MRHTSRITLTLLACACACTMIFSAAPAQADDSITAKLHAAVDAMSAEQQAALLLLISTLSDGAAPEACEAGAEETAAAGPMEALSTMLPKVLEAAKAEDLDAIMNLISKDFHQSDVGGKDDLRPFLENIIDMGYVEMYADEIEIITDDAELELDGDEASIYPIDIESPMGGVTIEILGKLEDGQWKVTGVEVY
jgi:hypothetical protein